MLENACSMVYPTEPQSGEGSSLDAAVTIALDGVLPLVKLPSLKGGGMDTLDNNEEDKDWLKKYLWNMKK